MKNFGLSFLKSYVVPAILIFLIPISSFFLFNHIIKTYDSQSLESVKKELSADSTITKQETKKILAFYEKNPPSKLCLSTNPQFEEFNKSNVSFCQEIQTVHSLITLSSISLIVSLITICLIVVLFSLSFISQEIQFRSFWLAWQSAKIFCFFQVLAQGTLSVGLSYYITAFFFHFYSLKLILIFAGLMFLACGKMIISLFQKIDTKFPVSGVLVSSTEAPTLLNRIQDICKKLEIKEPDNIVLGIENNFYVTEMPVSLNKTHNLNGRTLYISIFLLKQFTKEETDSVLAHEMAHFSGQDTYFSKKTSPLILRSNTFLNILSKNLITIPIFYFLLLFRSIFQLSFQKISRLREFRADQIASNIVSGNSFCCALLKLVIFSEFQTKLENESFSQKEKIEELNLFDKLNKGIQEYLLESNFRNSIIQTSTRHPFDSHPPVLDRIKAIDPELDIELLIEKINSFQVQESWFHEIQDAEKIQQTLIDEYENTFKKIHEENLAYRYLPSSEQEKEVNLKFFPKLEFMSSNQKTTLIFTYENIICTNWNNQLSYEDIEGATIKKGYFSSTFKINLKKNSIHKNAKYEIALNDFNGATREAFINAFSKYLYRHQTAQRISQEINK